MNGSARKPTDEQARIIEASANGSLKAAAFAGTGKTSTLVFVSEALSRRKILYLAFNRAMADEAKTRFPGHVNCVTAHGLAYRQVGYAYRSRLAGIMNLRRPIMSEFQGDLVSLVKQFGRSIEWVSFAVLGTLEKFQQSADRRPAEAHVPGGYWTLLPDAARPAFRAAVAEVTGRIWDAVTAPRSRLPATHDTYLKVWQLAGARVNESVILFDEAQDANPVMLAAIEAQRDAQKIYVGDRHQAIYGWRGAVNAMSKIDLPELALTQSFRFGPAIAELATRILAAKGETRAVRGLADGDEVIDEPALLDASAVLCRSNVGVIKELERAIRCGRAAAVVGGVEEPCNLLEAAYEFSLGGKSNHVDLRPFDSWQELAEFAETDEGAGYAPVVRLVEEYNSTIPWLTAMFRSKAVNEPDAEVVISTAHKAKGREWESVRLSDDFRPFAKEDPETGRPDFNEEEANLVYVACTRAKRCLNLGGYGNALQSSIRLAAEWYRMQQTQKPAQTEAQPRPNKAEAPKAASRLSDGFLAAMRNEARRLGMSEQELTALLRRQTGVGNE